ERNMEAIMVDLMSRPSNRTERLHDSKPRTVADLLWEMLANAGVKRRDGIVGDAGHRWAAPQRQDRVYPCTP
ncbi:MAG: hypothetical protein WBQ03_16900, partial [Candidatus Sulfotelmatobacter sp.]